MSASGSTPHLHLSQYDAGDRPSYVSDYTEDMGRIDTGFNLAQTNALTALNLVAALEQSLGSSGAVGQTVRFLARTADGGGVSGGGPLTLGFNGPMSTVTRNAEPADVPWRWGPTGGTPDTMALRFTDRGVYRVTVEAYAIYPLSLNISSAWLPLMVVDRGNVIHDEHYVPFTHCFDSELDGRTYGAFGSLVMPYNGVDSTMMSINFGTSFSDTTVHDAQAKCILTVDVEQIATEYEYSEQPSPGQPEPEQSNGQ